MENNGENFRNFPHGEEIGKKHPDFVTSCNLELDGTKNDDKVLLAPRIARNLWGKAWPLARTMDREKLCKEDGVEYMIDFINKKRGPEKIDELGEAFSKYFKSTELLRSHGEDYQDYELRHDKAVLDVTTALQSSGIEGTIPNELFGWWMLTFNLRLETSDAAIIRGKAPNYSLPRVQQAMREMWGAGTLAEKDQELRKRQGGQGGGFASQGKGRTFLAEQEDEYYEDEADEEGDEEEDENPVLALLEDEMMQAAAEITKVTNTMVEKGEDETVFAAMEEKKKTFETSRVRYQDARKALTRNRTNGAGFYPSPPAPHGQMRSARPSPKFDGDCLRCGKYGHRARDCRQGGKGAKGKGLGGGRKGSSKFCMSFMNVMSTAPDTLPKRVRAECNYCHGEITPREVDVTPCGFPVHALCLRSHLQTCLKPQCVHWVDPDWKNDAQVMVASSQEKPGITTESEGTVLATLKALCQGKAILDSGASDDIVGVETLQDHSEILDEIGFSADADILMNRQRTKNFVYGNDESGRSLGEATVTSGLLGEEVQTAFHVVEGGAPFLLSATWLRSMQATINFETAVGQFRALSNDCFQLERAPSGHLLFPLLLFAGNQPEVDNMRVSSDESISKLSNHDSINTRAVE